MHHCLPSLEHLPPYSMDQMGLGTTEVAVETLQIHSPDLYSMDDCRIIKTRQFKNLIHGSYIHKVGILLPYIGLQACLITSKQTEPDLKNYKPLKFHQHFPKPSKTSKFVDWRCSPLINIRVINFINKSYRRRYIGICIWKSHSYLPNTTLIKTCHIY